MKTSFLRHYKRLAVLALLVVVSNHPGLAASKPAAVVAPTAQASIQLVWDRVGSPIQIRV